MKKMLSLFSLAIIFTVLAIPVVSATSEKKDGYIWNHGTTSNGVYSNYDNNQPHSASVKADGTGTYRTSTNRSNVRVGAALYGVNSGRKAYYNYW